MTKNGVFLVAGLSVLLSLGGCATGGIDLSTDSNVSLNRNNFKIVKAGVAGKSRGFRFLGVIPLTAPSYAQAKAGMYKSSKEDLLGRSIALSNMTQDRSNLYLILFSIPKIVLTADFVEFQDDSPQSASPQ